MKEFIDKLIAKLEQESKVVTTPIIEIECLKLSDAIDAVKRVAEEYGNQVISSNDLEIIRALPSLYPLQDFEEEAIQRVVGNNSDGWIPVSSGKLPKGGDDVIVSYKDRYINHEDGTCDGFYDEVNQMWHLNDYEYCESAEVVAWRRRLAPYQQKGE